MSTDTNCTPPGDPHKQLKEEILADLPRLGPNDTFTFSCQPGISCFNRCCGDVNIFLTPYDVLRIKNRLGIDSTEFLDKYTLMPFQKDMKTPALVLKMSDDEKKMCPFVTEEGCGIYSDRPWPCRMYPIGVASPGDAREEEFFFVLIEDQCEGHGCGKEWTVAEWFADQEVDHYNEMAKDYTAITLHPAIIRGEPLDVKQTEMFFTACYDLDRFRRFLLDTTFFERFEVEPETIEAIQTDDEALLRFAYRWIRFSILGDPTVKIKSEVIENRKQELS